MWDQLGMPPSLGSQSGSLNTFFSPEEVKNAKEQEKQPKTPITVLCDLRLDSEDGSEVPIEYLL